MSIAGGVLVDRNETRHASAALVFRTHSMAGSLGCDHQNVEIRARLDQVEMNIEPVREHQRCTVFHILCKVIAINVALQLVGRKHHHDVGPFGRFRDLHNLEFFGLGFFHSGRGLAQGNCDLLHAAVAQIERVGMALTSVSDDCDLLALDQVQVGVAIVVNTHGTWSFWSFVRPWSSVMSENCPARGASRSQLFPGQVPPLFSVSLPLELQPAGVEQRETGQHAAVFDHLRQIGIRSKAIRADAGKADAARILQRIRLEENAQDNERDRQDRESHRYIPSGPRMIAAMPVRATSTRPSGSIRLMNCSILSLAPVISNTKLSVVASITRARKASASRSASTRLSPLPLTLTMASSRSMASPASVMSTT